jgi:hypothetical protein
MQLPAVPGLRVVQRTECGTFVEFRVALSQSGAELATKQLLAQLPDGGEITALEPNHGECYHQCQRIRGLLEVRRACHGALGTWRAATEDEALAWLLPGLLPSSVDPKHEQGVVRVPASSA